MRKWLEKSNLEQRKTKTKSDKPMSKQQFFFDILLRSLQLTFGKRLESSDRRHLLDRNEQKSAEGGVEGTIRKDSRN